MSVIDKTSVANVIAGFAVVSGVVVTVAAPEAANGELIRVIALTALGYLFGAATPAMAVGTEITVIIPQSVLEEIENISEFFKPGKSMVISLRHQVRMITERQVPSWMVVQIH